MVVFPNCKINLGLHVVRKRDDGFHDLETVFYPVPLTDALEAIHADDNTKGGCALTMSGLVIEAEQEENICVKAYHLLKKDFDLPSIKIHLHKTIPVGAGLGGGSADGAFMLLLLNKKFQLNITNETLMGYALQLGSDCPFFIQNRPSYATQRGEALQQLRLDLSAYKIVLINPRIHINTGWAYSQIKPNQHRTSILEIIQQPIEKWKDNLVNDFEEPVFKNHPLIKNIKEQLYEQGAAYASMSGSGSTLFGLFEKQNTPVLNFPKDYFGHWVN